MKLAPVEFMGAFSDGLHPIKGEEFEVNGRRLAVHRARLVIPGDEKFYKISELTHGFAVPIPDTTSKAFAIKAAHVAMSQVSDERWIRILAWAEQKKKGLRVRRDKST